ncbi:MAG: hypothetical protein DCC43_12600 [Candidatus Brocadia sp.]|nr:MAG: hypothetical protein DCC43_12600 [Candidatus Brocadia sp.]
MNRIERRYGKFRSTWLMDCVILTEDMLEKMRSRGIDYPAGTPKGHFDAGGKTVAEKDVD